MFPLFKGTLSNNTQICTLLAPVLHRACAHQMYVHKYAYHTHLPLPVVLKVHVLLVSVSSLHPTHPQFPQPFLMAVLPICIICHTVDVPHLHTCPCAPPMQSQFPCNSHADVYLECASYKGAEGLAWGRGVAGGLGAWLMGPAQAVR